MNTSSGELTARLAALRSDEGGEMYPDAVLWVGCLAVLALMVVVAVIVKIM